MVTRRWRSLAVCAWAIRGCGWATRLQSRQAALRQTKSRRIRICTCYIDEASSRHLLIPNHREPMLSSLFKAILSSLTATSSLALPRALLSLCSAGSLRLLTASARPPPPRQAPDPTAHPFFFPVHLETPHQNRSCATPPPPAPQSVDIPPTFPPLCRPSVMALSQVRLQEER